MDHGGPPDEVPSASVGQTRSGSKKVFPDVIAGFPLVGHELRGVEEESGRRVRPG